MTQFQDETGKIKGDWFSREKKVEYRNVILFPVPKLLGKVNIVESCVQRNSPPRCLTHKCKKMGHMAMDGSDGNLWNVRMVVKVYVWNTRQG